MPPAQFADHVVPAVEQVPNLHMVITTCRRSSISERKEKTKLNYFALHLNCVMQHSFITLVPTHPSIYQSMHPSTIPSTHVLILPFTQVHIYLIHLTIHPAGKYLSIHLSRYISIIPPKYPFT